MGNGTAIEWTDSTFNPWIGCTKVGPGCDHCYAEADMDKRRHRVKWGAGQERSRTSVDYWKQPLRWNLQTFVECDPCGCRYAPKDHDSCPECQGLTSRVVRRRVFCASLADVFDNEIDPAWRADLFNLIAATPNLDWLLLTKRIGNAAAMIESAVSSARSNVANSWSLPAWPWPNVWLGATVVNQEEAERDIDKLLRTPAALHFLSVEPMLGPITVTPNRMLDQHCFVCAIEDGSGVERGTWSHTQNCVHRLKYLGTRTPANGIGWVICGGESGPGARPMDPAWARSLRDQCAAAGVPFLFKQWGEYLPAQSMADITFGVLSRPKGAQDEHWVGNQVFFRLGKKGSGRALDGVLHDAFPEALNAAP